MRIKKKIFFIKNFGTYILTETFDIIKTELTFTQWKEHEYRNKNV